MCLSYLDESTSPPEWKCQDSCLTRKGASVCGETGHFTSFAVLLDGGGGGSGCNGDSEGVIDEVVTYLSLGSVIVAIILIVLAIIILELYHTKHKKDIKQRVAEKAKSRKLEQMNSLHTSLNKPPSL